MRPLRAFLTLASCQLIAAAAVHAADVVSGQADLCHDVVIPVHVAKSAEGNFTGSYDVNILFALAARKTLVAADYNISARVCKPPTNVAALDTVQILAHGATFNKKMWDFPYKPEEHSWTRRMTNAGYTTVAVDLIGAGNSSFPDGLKEAQTETAVQAMHEVIRLIREGQYVGRQFKQMAFVGFSIGGIIANGLADKYPHDVDVYVLIGISWDLTWIYPAFLAGLQTSARTIDPDRWGHLEPFYQTQPTIEAREVACFYGDYEKDALAADFATRDFDTLGAAITFTYHLVDAPHFTGPVFLGIGENDGTFCGGPKCGSQPYAVYDKFPTASAHDVKVYANTGHAILYHRSGPKLMEDVQSFLAAHRP
ncbi:Hydrolase [Pyrenophora tritici-repentis]|nr:Hydrolase [Pyrenophora tritici-repentis]